MTELDQRITKHRQKMGELRLQRLNAGAKMGIWSLGTIPFITLAGVCKQIHRPLVIKPALLGAVICAGMSAMHFVKFVRVGGEMVNLDPCESD